MDFGRSDYNEVFDGANIENSPFEPDEPVFMLRGTDPIAPKVLLRYATDLISVGSDNRIVDSVIKHAQKMMAWQTTHKTKYPDLIRDDANRVEKLSRIKEIISSIEVDHKISSAVYEELFNIMDYCYGVNSLKILGPNELDPQVSGYVAKDQDTIAESLLVIGITEQKEWIILKNCL